MARAIFEKNVLHICSERHLNMNIWLNIFFMAIVTYIVATPITMFTTKEMSFSSAVTTIQFIKCISNHID